MPVQERITAIVIFLLSGVLFLLSILHFMERGVLLNNACLYASKQARQTMDKGPYYRQSAVIFGLLGVLFLVIGLSLVLRNDRILWAELPLLAVTVGYAIRSSVLIERNGKK